MNPIKSRGLNLRYREGVVAKYNNSVQLELFHAAFGALGNDDSTMRRAFRQCVMEGRLHNTDYEAYTRWLLKEAGRYAYSAIAC
jgi:hypothetical protein